MPGRAIVVEDDDILRNVITEALALLGFRSIEFSSADEALVFLANNEPVSLVVTDVHMPGVHDGLELAQHVWKTLPALPVIIISGKAVIPYDHLSRSSMFLRKPFSVDALHHAVTVLVQGQHGSSDNQPYP